MATDFSDESKANVYSEGIPSKEFSLNPIIFEKIGDVEGKNILDLGCGDGEYSKIFAEKGAKVIGIDHSEKQIEIANNVNKHEDIRYLKLNGELLDEIEGEFDIIFMNLVVPSLDNTEKLKNIVKECRKLMGSNSIFLFTILHPLYLSPEQDETDRAVDFDKKKYFEKDYCYNSRALTNKGNEMKFYETHFSLNTLSEILEENKFLIKSLTESKAVPDKGIYLPKYLLFECVKDK